MSRESMAFNWMMARHLRIHHDMDSAEEIAEELAMPVQVVEAAIEGIEEVADSRRPGRTKLAGGRAKPESRTRTPDLRFDANGNPEPLPEGFVDSMTPLPERVTGHGDPAELGEPE